jgi:hypothetical protein
LGENLTLTVYNVLGNKIYQQSNITGKSFELSSAVLGKGVYILTAESSDLNQPVQTARLIVQ